MTAEGRRLELDRPRDLSALFSDAFAVLRSQLGAFLALSAVVVVPVHLIVSGIGLEQLTGAYEKSPSVGEKLIPAVVSYLVVGPLLNAMCIRVLTSVAEGGSPSVRRAIVEGFEAFTPIFFAMLLAAAGIALGLVLVVPGIYLAVRWFFVPQTVVIDGARGTRALAGSMRVTDGFWWRTFGIMLVAYLAAAIPGVLLSAPFTALADSTGRAVWQLAGTIVTEIVTTPFVVLVATLLYFDLRARRAEAP